MQFNYDESEKRVLAHEGGYTNDAHDPGGPTNWGITIYDARTYWNKDATADDVRTMPLAVAKQIYRTKYWARLNCDLLPSGVDYAVFDYGVNSGVGRAGKVLRQLLNLNTESSGVTPEVISAAVAANPAKLIDAICDERLRFLQGLGIWSIYGHGWATRVAEVRIAAKAMAAGEIPHPIEHAKASLGGREMLAQQLLAAHTGLGYAVAYGENVINIAYIEGVDPDGTRNDNRPNVFNDLRIVWRAIEGASPRILGMWEATTEPGRYWTENPMDPGGAAHIALGQQAAWVMGEYHGAPALVEAAPIKFTRDPKKNYQRYGKEFTASIGVHQHAGYNYPHDELGRSSAGCLVGRTTTGHAEFMALCASDARYKKDKNFRFPTAVFTAAQVLAGGAAVPVTPKVTQPHIPIAVGATAGAAAASTGVSHYFDFSWGEVALVVVAIAVVASLVVYLIKRKP